MTVSVILRDLPCKNGNVLFTKLTLYYFCELLHCFLWARNVQAIFVEKPQMKIESLMKQKHWSMGKKLDQTKLCYHCETGIANFVWKVKWINAYSPFKVWKETQIERYIKLNRSIDERTNAVRIRDWKEQRGSERMKTK